MGGRTALLGAACLVSALLLAGCGSSSVPPEAVVRAWSDAVNTGENERAAKLFADDAIAIRGSRETTLRGFDDAVRWNEALACGGLVREIATHGDIVTASFELVQRTGGTCSAARGTATYEFEVRRNHIIFLRLLAALPPPAAGTSTAPASEH